MSDTICPKTGEPNRFLLGDDGTLDTVVYCSECSREYRFSFDREMSDETEEAYDDFVEWALEDAAEMHDAEVDDE